MKRKVVKQGSATLMVSLPSKWVKKFNIQKGDEVTIDIQDQMLLLSPYAETSFQKRTKVYLINLTESSIRTVITNTYRKGYDLIDVYFDTEEQFKILEEVIPNLLIGFEITTKEKNKCTVESVTEPSPEQFDSLLKKIFFSIQNLLTSTKDFLEKKQIQEDMHALEERIQRYDNFCRRVLSKQKFFVSSPEFFWTFLTLLIHAQREIYFIHKFFHSKIKVSQKTISLLEGTSQIFTLLRKVYEEKNVAYLSEIHTIEKKLIYELGYEALKEAEPQERMILYHLLSSIRQFYQANSPLFGLIL